MYNKLLLSVLLFFACAANLFAGVSQTVTINNQTVSKTVAQITFSGDNVTLTFSDGTSLSEDMANVIIDFSNESSTATSMLPFETFQLNGTVDGNLSIGNLTDGTPVMVYDSTGRQIAATKAKGNHAHLDISASRGGVYILKAGNQVVKFMKK